MEASISWYEQVLGLKKYQLKEWGDFPVFMLSGKSGVAIFPANTQDPAILASSKNIKIDHFAFNLSKDNFALARQHYESLNLAYHFQDHHYFHSIYTKDPDGHTVELTTLVVEESTFYQSE
jgi:catechol-2,3-dioxygenase